VFWRRGLINFTAPRFEIVEMGQRGRASSAFFKSGAILDIIGQKHFIFESDTRNRERFREFADAQNRFPCTFSALRFGSTLPEPTAAPCVSLTITNDKNGSVRWKTCEEICEQPLHRNLRPTTPPKSWARFW
jgi:hypothetical protein